MSAQENRLNGKLDRDRGRAGASARTLQVRELAKATINCAVMEIPEADRAEYMNASIRHLRTLYGSGEGEAEAVALFGSLAWSATLQTARVVAGARAEQLFAKKPANDRDYTSCSTCHGSGVVLMTGHRLRSEPIKKCPRCGGEGLEP